MCWYFHLIFFRNLGGPKLKLTVITPWKNKGLNLDFGDWCEVPGNRSNNFGEGSAEVFTMNNYLVSIGNTSKGKRENLPKITVLARSGFEIPLSLPHALITTLFPYKCGTYLHILM